jgi:lysophospholipase L1-like esterase
MHMKSRATAAALVIASSVATVIAAVTLAAPSRASTPTFLYAALGDSYSSGEGNPPFDTASRTDGCDRSSQAWPRLIASQHSTAVQLVAHIACSGATSSSLFTTFKTETAQTTHLTALTPQPTLVTVTIGGNDLGFSSILTDCFLLNCVNDGRVSKAKHYLETTLPALLVNDYTSIANADKSARVVVVGYPSLFPSGTPVGCGWLASNEKTALRALATEFDHTMAAAAASAGVQYVSVLSVLAGHELCTSTPWVYPIGLTGGDLRGHPTAHGQQAIANTVYAAVTS